MISFGFCCQYSVHPKKFLHNQEINSIHLCLKLLIKLLKANQKRIYLHVFLIRKSFLADPQFS